MYFCAWRAIKKYKKNKGGWEKGFSSAEVRQKFVKDASPQFARSLFLNYIYYLTHNNISKNGNQLDDYLRRMLACTHRRIYMRTAGLGLACG